MPKEERRMVSCEQHAEWAVVRRSLGADALAKARVEVIEGEEVRSEARRGELMIRMGL